MKRFRAMSKIKQVMCSILILFLIYLLYVIISATLPFMGSPEVSQDYKDKFNPQKFYSENLGVDRAAIVETSQDALDVRLHMIEQAKHQIAISSFSIKHDQSCHELASTILAAANRGVKVRILVDGLTGYMDMDKDPIYYVLGTHPNIEIRFYNMLSLLRPWTVNGRLHDKYFIVDDQLLVLGGRNISDYFLGEYNLNSLSYDRDILVYNTKAGETGKESVLYEVLDYFDTVWNCEYSETVFNSIKDLKKESLEAAKNSLETLYRTLKKERSEVFLPIDYTKVTIATNKITLVSNPIHIMTKQPYVLYELGELMKHAKERVYIQTPYAVLNDDMYELLTQIRNNVPEFKMLINSRAGGDNFCASSDYTLNQKKILRTGVSIYEFQGAYSMHNKSLLIDDDISVIGSYNLDMRSTYLDTEVMLVVHSKEFNQKLATYIDAMEAQSLPVNADGSYGTNGEVTPLLLTQGKRLLFDISSVFFQLIRYLLQKKAVV